MKQWAGLLAGLFLVLMASNANASLRLTLDDPGDAFAATVIFDAGLGDLNPAAGAVTFLGSIGVWTINVTTGLSKPAIGPLQMDLNSVDVSSGAGTLIITLSDTDFVGVGSIAWVTQIGGTTAGTVSAKAWVDPDNILGSTDGPDLLASLGPLGPGAFSATSSALTGTLTGLFSSTIEVRITHTGEGSTSFDISTAVPEPATMLLLGVGLATLGGMVGLRRRNT